jgi:hypothetical protein
MKLANMYASEAYAERLVGSSPTRGTYKNKNNLKKILTQIK